MALKQRVERALAQLLRQQANKGLRPVLLNLLAAVPLKCRLRGFKLARQVHAVLADLGVEDREEEGRE